MVDTGRSLREAEADSIIPYCPHNGQAILHNDPHRFKTICCGRRWGKTVYADNKLIREAVMKPGTYAYIAPTYAQAKLITWEMLKYYSIPKIVKDKPNETELSIDYKSGGSVRLFGADKPDRIRGAKFDGLIIDEFADIKRRVWELILRPTLADTRGWADFVGTPKGKLNHFYEIFIKDPKLNDPNYRDIFGKSVLPDEDFKSFRFRTEDNPYISREEIDKARYELAPQYFRQEWEASFENYTGIIYKEFDLNKHLFDSVNILPWWNIYVGIDTGRTTAVSFLAVNEKNQSYVFDEIYDRDGLVPTICEQIKSKLKDYKCKSPLYVIDSASQVKREYAHYGITALDSEKDVENQIQQVRDAFSNDLLSFGREKAKMHIVEHQGYVWDEKSKKIQPIKENDHTCNSLQYIYSTYLKHKSKDKVSGMEFKRSLLGITQRKAKTGVDHLS